MKKLYTGLYMFLLGRIHKLLGLPWEPGLDDKQAAAIAEHRTEDGPYEPWKD